MLSVIHDICSLIKLESFESGAQYISVNVIVSKHIFFWLLMKVITCYTFAFNYGMNSDDAM